MTESSTEPGPTVREWCVALALVALAATAFLGRGLWPGRVVAPYPLEALEPMRSAALADGTSPESLLRGNAGLGDKWNQSIAWDRVTQDSLRERGRLPLWTREIAGGAPFVPQMGQIYQPWNLALLLPIPSVELYGPWFFAHQIVIGLLAFGFLRRLGRSNAASALGAIAAVVGLWTQARIHHNVILSAALPAFGMLAAVLSIHRQRAAGHTAPPFAAIAWLGLWTALSWLGGLPQVSLLISLMTIAWTMTLAFGRSRDGRAGVGWTALGMAIGGLIGILMLGPVLVAAGLTARGLGTPELFQHKALAPAHLLGLIWPDLLHWPADAFYGAGIETVRHSFAALWLLDWTRLNAGNFSYAETTMFVGTIPLVFAIHGVVAAWRRTARPDLPSRTDTGSGIDSGDRAHSSWPGDRRIVSFFAIVAAIGTVAALAVPPIPWLASITPGLNTGDLKRWIYLPAFALPILAAHGCDAVLSRRGPWSWSALLGIALVSVVLASLHSTGADAIAERFAHWTTAGRAVSPEQFLAAVQWPDEAVANATRLFATFARSALVAGLGAVALWWLGRRTTTIRTRVVAWGLVIATAVELIHAGAGTIVAVPSATVTEPPAVLAPVLAATAEAAAQDPPAPPPRIQRLGDATTPGIAPLLRQNLGAYWGLSDFAAYNPLSPRRMEAFATAIEPGIALGGAGVELLRRPASLRHPLTRLLGIDWILAPTSSEAAVLAAGFERRDEPQSGVPFGLYERTAGRIPRVGVIEHAVVITDPDVRLRRLADPERDPQREIVLEAELPSDETIEDASANRRSGGDRPPQDGDPAAAILRVEHHPERVAIDLDVRRPAWLRLADPWDPGWTVRVDGAERRLWIADHYLRAVRIRPGDRRIEFRYDGATVSWPQRIGSLGILAWLATVGLALAQRWRARRRHHGPKPDHHPAATPAPR